MSFKRGDRVKCVDDWEDCSTDNLGKTFTVSEVENWGKSPNFYQLIGLKEVKAESLRVHAHCFILLTPLEELL